MALQLFPEKEGVSWSKFYCRCGCADYITKYEIFQFQVRSAAGGNGFTGRSILLAGSPAYLLDMFCRIGEQEKTSSSYYPLPFWLMGRSTDLTTSAEVQRGLSSHVWALSSHLLTASAHQIAHCS